MLPLCSFSRNSPLPSAEGSQTRNYGFLKKQSAVSLQLQSEEHLNQGVATKLMLDYTGFITTRVLRNLSVTRKGFILIEKGFTTRFVACTAAGSKLCHIIQVWKFGSDGPGLHEGISLLALCLHSNSTLWTICPQKRWTHAALPAAQKRWNDERWFQGGILLVSKENFSFHSQL